MTGTVRLRVRTPHGDATYEVPKGRVASILGLEVDSDLLSGATLTTDPARFSDDLPWVHAAPDWGAPRGAEGCEKGAAGVRRGVGRGTKGVAG